MGSERAEGRPTRQRDPPCRCRGDSMRFVRPAVPPMLSVLLLMLASAPHAFSEPVVDLGTRVPDFQLQDLAGKPVRIADAKDRKATVVVFLNFDCPVCASYCPILADLAKAYAGKGVAFLAVCPGGDMELAEVAKQAERVQARLPCLSRPFAAVVGAQGEDDARGVRPRPQPRAALPRPHRRRLLRPAQEEHHRSPSTTCATPSTRCSPASR